MDVQHFFTIEMRRSDLAALQGYNTTRILTCGLMCPEFLPNPSFFFWFIKVGDEFGHNFNRMHKRSPIISALDGNELTRRM